MTAPPFPFLDHLTMAEVDEYERLLSLSQRKGLSREDGRRMVELSKRRPTTKRLEDGREREGGPRRRFVRARLALLGKSFTADKLEEAVLQIARNAYVSGRRAERRDAS